MRQVNCFLRGICRNDPTDTHNNSVAAHAKYFGYPDMSMYEHDCEKASSATMGAASSTTMGATSGT